jgi:hypothetical protein
LGGGEQPRKFYQTLCKGLYAYAEWSFRNGRKLSDGASEGDHKAAAKRQFEALGWRVSEEIAAEPPELPAAIAYVWAWFQEIIRGIQGSGFSYPVITWTELDSWSRLTRNIVSPHEARTLIVLGTMRANIMSEKPTDGGKG